MGLLESLIRRICKKSVKNSEGVDKPPFLLYHVLMKKTIIIKYHHPKSGEVVIQSVDSPDQLGNLIEEIHSSFAKRYSVDVVFEVKVKDF